MLPNFSTYKGPGAYSGPRASEIHRDLAPGTFLRFGLSDRDRLLRELDLFPGQASDLAAAFR